MRQFRGIFSALTALALCLSLLPTTALAADSEWEHTDHTGWTELTVETLTKSDYTLSAGNYYFSGTLDDWGESYVLTTTEPLTINGTVTLCLNNTRYTYEGSVDAAIVVSEDADLTICCCQRNDWGGYDGGISNSNVSYGIYNKGTLTVTGGSISINKENGAAIYNVGTCTISGGSMSGTAGWWENYQTAYGIFNASGANLTISGSPSISGTAPGDMNDPSGPLIDILTYETICVDDLDMSSLDNYRTYHIGYYGTPGEAVVSGVEGASNPSWGNEEEYLAATWMRFQLTYPENSEFIYTPPEGDAPGTLTYAGHTSLTYGDTNVMDNIYYKVDASGSGLEEGTEADYDIFWDEEGRTLTLNNVMIETHIEDFTDADSLFSTALEDGITINLIGENSITVYSHYHNIDRDAYAIANTAGGVTLQSEDMSASLAIHMLPGINYSARDIAGISAAGLVENKATLTISSDKAALEKWTGNMTGVECSAFTNSGTFTVNISNAGSACGVDTGNFDNSGTVDIGFTDVANGTGIWLTGGTSFVNSGMIGIDIPDADSARGIVRYRTSGISVDNNFSWTNTENGAITIDVSGEGDATAAMGGQALAGMDLRSGEDITFVNHGTITATATSDGPAALEEPNWPSWQYFDTLGVLLLCDECHFTNTGAMKLTALNGYTAGISIGGANDDDIFITNSGELDITTTTMGGDNIRSVGIYAQIPGIESSEVQQLNFNTTGGTIAISTNTAEGCQVNPDSLMAICLVQTFTTDSVPNDTEPFQQITGEGMALSGQPVVIKVENDGKNQTAFINTIGTVNEDGTVTPATGMIVVPTIPGTVTIEGTPQVGCTLTAQVSGLPDGVAVTYQWQSADSGVGPYTDIPGATTQTYAPASSDIGKYLRVVVTPTGETYGGSLTATASTAVTRPSSGGGSSEPSYSPSVDAGRGGDVSTNPRTPHEGDDVTITVDPDEGYEVDEVIVTDRNGGKIDVTDNGDGTYTFEQPRGRVTISVTFRPIQQELLPFTDVAKGAWYYDAVAYAYANGLMSGTSSTTFAPDVTTSRGMIATILWRIADSPVVNYLMDYDDVAEGSWYTEAIRWATSEGVVSGYGNGMFGPDDPITREQFAVILYRCAQYMGCDVTARADLSRYTDADQISGYAAEALAWANAEGIVNGTGGGSTLSPQGEATRAQAAVMLMRFCQRYIDNAE